MDREEQGHGIKLDDVMNISLVILIQRVECFTLKL